MEKAIAIEVEMDTKTPVFVTISTFKSERRLDIRKYYITDEGKTAPTQKGINIPVDAAEALIEAIEKALTEERS